MKGFSRKPSSKLETFYPLAGRTCRGHCRAGMPCLQDMKCCSIRAVLKLAVNALNRCCLLLQCISPLCPWNACKHGSCSKNDIGGNDAAGAHGSGGERDIDFLAWNPRYQNSLGRGSGRDDARLPLAFDTTRNSAMTLPL